MVKAVNVVRVVCTFPNPQQPVQVHKQACGVMMGHCVTPQLCACVGGVTVGTLVPVLLDAHLLQQFCASVCYVFVCLLVA